MIRFHRRRETPGNTYETNAALGYTLPDLDPGSEIVSATVHFEVVGARDHVDIDPSLDVYLLDFADPSTTGDDLFWHTPNDPNTNVAKVGGVYIDVGTSTTNYPDDTYDFAMTLTGDALDLLLSFYGGDHLPDQTEALFRINLDGFVEDISSSALNRYYLDTAVNETRLEIATVGAAIPTPMSAMLGLLVMGLAGLRRRRCYPASICRSLRFPQCAQ